MANQYLNSEFQNKIKLQTELQYKSYWDELELPSFIQEKFLVSQLSQDVFISTFRDSASTPIKVYLTTFLINIIFVQDLIEEEQEEELLEFWECSEFTALFFSNNTKSDATVLRSSGASLELLVHYFIDYWQLMFLEKPLKEALYKYLPEVGDFSDCLYLGDSMGITDHVSNYEEVGNGFIKLINPKVISDIPELKIPIKNSSLVLRPGSSEGLEKLEVFRDKISKSVFILEKLAPDLLNTLHSFTHTVIALNEPGMVSYSVQSLPGYSTINLFERDLVDCIDDLIHENGHHYLNYILNSKNLIIENIEKEFFSPWRMTLRPIRGIYHGVFTFYWALELFSQLLSNDDLDQYFSQVQICKIRLRYIEEFYRLSSCRGPLGLAHDQGLINEEGQKIITEILSIVESNEESVLFNLLKLDKKDKKKISIMIESLES